VCYGHRKDPLGGTLGHYSLLPNRPDEIKKIVHDGIGGIILFLEAVSRSVWYLLQSSNNFLDVKDKYKIPDKYDHKHLDKETTRRGFAIQFCVVVDYWSSVPIDNNLYYTNLSCLSEDTDNNSTLFFFVFPYYRVVVPMHYGDVICLNPLIYHLCTDPIKRGVENFSCVNTSGKAGAQILHPPPGR
jgi:hypothetical protein